ncbi:CAAX protease self-immunity-domain-containing protein [Haematococcus lacustris]
MQAVPHLARLCPAPLQMVMLQGALSLALGAASRRSRSQLFNFSLASPLQPGRGWLWWASLGCGALALNAMLCQSLGYLLHTLLPPLAGLPGLGLSSWVEQWSSGGQGAPCLAVGDERSLPARCRWWVESCVAAPVLEETLFRGFLLASFTRWLPAWGAVLASSALFTACHLGSLAAQDLPQVLGAGVVLGLLYLRSGSLLAPVAAHSFTNTLALLTS